MYLDGFHGQLALDRQSQLLRDVGVDGPAAAHVAMSSASRRAEAAANRKNADPLNLGSRLVLLNPASKLVFALSEWRRMTRTRPGLFGA
jgi:hypothetical protein